jgi:tetratricopeptide (TPR) repeat protein
MRCVRLVLILVVLSALPSWANLKQDARGCGSENDNAPDKMISACSAAISLGHLKGVKLAIAYNNRGSAHNNKSEYDQAIQDFDEAIRLNPSYVKALTSRGIAYYSKGDRDHAIQDFDQAIKLSPDDVIALKYRGLAYYDKGEYDRAIQDFDQVVKLDPSQSKAFGNRGRAYSDKGEYDRAIKDYDQAIQLDPNYFQAFYYRGLACENKGDHDLAIRDYDQALRLSPNYGLAFKGRGDAYNRRHDYDHAIQDFDQAIRLDQNDETTFRGRGDAYIYKGDYDQAIQDYDQAIKLNPKDAAAFRNRALAYDKKGDRDHAIQDYNQTIQLDPKSVDAFYGRGNDYESKGDHDRAIEDFNEVIRLKPNFAGAIGNRGLAYSSNGDYDRAIQDFNEVTRLDPNLAQAYYGRGNVYNQQGDYDRAIKELDEALRLDSNFPLAYASRGFAHDIKGEFDQAMQDYNQAVRLNPSDTGTLQHRGVLYEKQGQDKLAIADFDEALRLNPGDANVLRNRGFAHFFLGEFDDSQKDLAILNAYPYPAIWLYLARSRAGQQEAKSELAKDAAKFDLKVWPGPVVSMYLGKTTPEAFVEATRDKDPKKNREQRCEAFFYVGQRALIAGKQDQANRLLQRSQETHAADLFEYMGAQAELQRTSTDAARQCGVQVYKDPDAALRFCSTAIGSGQLEGASLARLYNHRGNAYLKKAQYDLAIQDYSQAIKLKPVESKTNPAQATSSEEDGIAEDFGTLLDLDLPNGLDLDDMLGSQNPYASAFADRGVAYEHKGEYIRAIQDYGQAIKLDPHFTVAFSERAGVFKRKGKYERAIKDYDKAIQDLPSLASLRGWYDSRGVVHFYLSQFAAAQQDFTAVLAKVPNSYAAIWLYLARVRAGQSASDELADYAAKLDLKNWPGPVIDLYLGKATPDAVLAAAKDSDPKKDKERHCAAYFYLGQKALLEHKRAKARHLFQQSLDTRFTNSDMYRGSQAELQRLSAPPAQHRR